jgi:hypothetical protein
MRRREFIASLFSSAAVGTPLSARGEAPKLDEALGPLAVQREQLLLDLQNANRRLAEAEEHLSQVHLQVYHMKCALTLILMASDVEWHNTRCELSDDVRVSLTLINSAGERMVGHIREVFERAIATRKRASADLNRLSASH